MIIEYRWITVYHLKLIFTKNIVEIYREVELEKVVFNHFKNIFPSLEETIDSRKDKSLNAPNFDILKRIVVKTLCVAGKLISLRR